MRPPSLAFLAFIAAQAAQFGIDLLGRLFADVTGVEDHHVGAFGRIGRGIAQRRQQIRHPGGIIGVHLAAIGLDVELLHLGAGYRVRKASKFKVKSQRPGQGFGLAGLHDFLRFGRQGLAVHPVQAERFMELDHHIQRPGQQRLPQMRHHFHVAIPGKQRPVFPPHRQAVQAGKGDRDRLHLHMPAAGQPRFGRAQQRALERQHAVAVMAGAFGKQQQGIARRQPLVDGIARRAGGAAPRALDKDGALQPRQGAEEGPGADLGLGDKGQRRRRRKDHDVGPAGVIGHHQHAFARHRLADDADVDAEQPRRPGGDSHAESVRAARAAQFQQQPLHRHQRAG